MRLRRKLCRQVEELTQRVLDTETIPVVRWISGLIFSWPVNFRHLFRSVWVVRYWSVAEGVQLPLPLAGRPRRDSTERRSGAACQPRSAGAVSCSGTEWDRAVSESRQPGDRAADGRQTAESRLLRPSPDSCGRPSPDSCGRVPTPAAGRCSTHSPRSPGGDSG